MKYPRIIKSLMISLVMEELSAQFLSFSEEIRISFMILLYSPTEDLK